jgi:hypothetical protein
MSAGKDEPNRRSVSPGKPNPSSRIGPLPNEPEAGPTFGGGRADLLEKKRTQSSGQILGRRTPNEPTFMGRAGSADH